MRPDAVPRGGTSPSASRIEVVRPAARSAFAAIVMLRGEHDLATSGQVSETIGSIAGNVLVDLSDCAFIDSTVIGALIRTSKDLKSDGHVLEIVAPPANETITRTLEVVRLRDLIVVHEAANLT
jgi:anti-anti-sigma factor